MAEFVISSNEGTSAVIEVRPSTAFEVVTNKGEKGDVGPVGPKGDKGDQGIQGVKGDVGPTGPANTLSVGSVTGGATADATITGTAPNQTLNLVLPKGDKGDAGPTGATGPTGPAGADGAQGPAGPAGADGPAGPPNVLSIGTVSNGTTADATITGTSPSQTLNLVLPKGDKGDKGDPGPTGTGTGDMLASVYDPAGGARQVAFADEIGGGGTWGSITGTLSAQTDLQTALNAKVDKVTGKGLSTEDYTTTEKTKLAGIEAGAQVNTVASVAGKTGAVTLAKGDVGLNNVDNTSDATKNAAVAVVTNKDFTSGTNTFPTFNQSTTGNAATATKLQTARTINGVSFDGSANITLPGLTWSVKTASLTGAVNTGNIMNGATQLTLTLPGTAAVGSTIRVAGMGAGGWKIATLAGDNIVFGSTSTTAGTAGYLASTDPNDAVELLCTVANTTWTVISSVGNITVA